MEEFRVSSWSELHDRLYEGSWQEPLRRFRSNLAFRGVNRSSWELQTGLAREGAFLQHEGHLLRNFRKYARRDAVPDDSSWNWMALAQHHGLPTRLVDWTYSPFVALHFATAELERFGEDAVVWCLDYVATNRFLPEPLKRVLEEEGSNVFTAEMLGRVAGSLRELDRLSEEEFVLFLEPPSFNERLVNQFALFSLSSSPRASLQRWLQERPGLARRIVIPAELKWEVRDKLDQANVTERVLFPGLDSLSSWLKRYYSPRRP
ncbi:MAG: FRG domain-containing protein [Gemmatimonadetes bacterium]|nr:FRG domain-containing protein [Gemmatimonadota bacterium]